MIQRVLILVEGQTEERFVKDVLNPVFSLRNLAFNATILTTKRVKNGPDFKGGVTTFGKFRNDALRLLSRSNNALVTTLLDYYGLPADFPGMKTRPTGTAIRRVTHVERAIAESFDSPPNFLPFLALHEFEAWIFSSPNELPKMMTPDSHAQSRFGKICSEFATPEEINERPEHSPSKRIAAIFPVYRKTIHGPTAIKRIGLDRIRARCPHFNEWLAKIESFSSR